MLFDADRWGHIDGSLYQLGLFDVRHAFVPPLEFVASEPVAGLQQRFCRGGRSLLRLDTDCSRCCHSISLQQVSPETRRFGLRVNGQPAMQEQCAVIFHAPLRLLWSLPPQQRKAMANRPSRHPRSVFATCRTSSSTRTTNSTARFLRLCGGAMANCWLPSAAPQSAASWANPAPATPIRTAICCWSARAMTERPGVRPRN